MIVERKVFEDETGKCIETIYDSSNILKSLYFPLKNKLYIHFSRGHTYSYNNFDNETYQKFENSDSQGKFFREYIDNNKTKYSPYKEFLLTENELKDIKGVIKEWKIKNT